MKIAVFTDVHGNRFALESVLKEIELKKPDLTLNLGDGVWGSADPMGAWRLQQSCGALEVRGNTDEYVMAEPDSLEGSKSYTQWLQAQLTPQVAEHLRTVPVNRTALEGQILATHGTPNDPWTAFFNESYQQQLGRLAPYPGVKVVLVGHTHNELLEVQDGITRVNVGAVSRQKDGDPWARWVLLEQKGTRFNVTFRRVEYDVEAAVRWILEHYPNGEREAAQLRSGRA